MDEDLVRIGLTVPAHGPIAGVAGWVSRMRVL